jgi:3-methyladenine DNA glycosylase/8-oxoguanine DNA glycosylase
MSVVSASGSNRRLELDAPLDLRLTLMPLQRGGRNDPAVRVGAREAWRASHTPEGPATLHLEMEGTIVEAQAWGPGAGVALDNAPGLLGLADDATSFRPRHPLLADLHRRHAGMRMTRTGAVLESLVPTILEQKVPGIQACYGYRRIVEELGEPAPGPFRLQVPPSAARLAATPYWAFHRYGVERRRAETIRLAGRHARRLEESAAMPLDQARKRLMALPGMGPWTAAEVALLALGDADAVSVGDFHLPHLVSWALAGEARGSDARMLELLQPYSGHRGRVLRLLTVSGLVAPRFGPRLPLRWIASS